MIEAHNADWLLLEGQLRSLELDEELADQVEAGQVSYAEKEAARLQIEQRYERLAIRAQVLAGLAALEQLWTENGGTLPLPDLRALSGWVTKKQVYEVLRTAQGWLAPADDPRANVSRTFQQEVIDKGALVAERSRQRVLVDLRALRDAHPRLDESAVAGLGRPKT